MLKRLLFICLLVPMSISAQVDTSAIAGTLHDPTGAIISSANVTITNQATSSSTVVQVDSQGNYTSPPLRVGTYSVAVEATGFQSQTRTGITLEVQDRRRIDFVLTVGQVSQNVSVTDQAPVMQTDNSSLGQVISSKTKSPGPGKNCPSA